MALRLSEGVGITVAPLCASDLVQAVWTQRTSFRHPGVFKVGVLIEHANAFHDCDRRQIAQGCERDDLFEPELLKPDAQTLLCALCGVAIAPGRSLQAPADLNARTER